MAISTLIKMKTVEKMSTYLKCKEDGYLRGLHIIDCK